MAIWTPFPEATASNPQVTTKAVNSSALLPREGAVAGQPMAARSSPYDTAKHEAHRPSGRAGGDLLPAVGSVNRVAPIVTLADASRCLCVGHPASGIVTLVGQAECRSC